MKKILVIIIVIILFIQSAFLIFNKESSEIKDESIESVKKDKNIEEVLSDLENISNLEIYSYNKVDNKWRGSFKFKGDLEESKGFIRNVEKFYISDYYIEFKDDSVYIEGFLEHK